MTVGYFWMPLFNLFLSIELYTCIDDNFLSTADKVFILPMEFVANALEYRFLQNAVAMTPALMTI